MVRQSRVTVPCGPALILVHVTRHFDFGRMRKMVQKKKHVQVPYQRYHSHYQPCSQTSLPLCNKSTHVADCKSFAYLSISVANSALSQVTPQVVRVSLSKRDRRVTGHTPGRINRNGTVLLQLLYSAWFKSRFPSHLFLPLLLLLSHLLWLHLLVHSRTGQFYMT